MDSLEDDNLTSICNASRLTWIMLVHPISATFPIHLSIPFRLIKHPRQDLPRLDHVRPPPSLEPSLRLKFLLELHEPEDIASKSEGVERKDVAPVEVPVGNFGVVLGG